MRNLKNSNVETAAKKAAAKSAGLAALREAATPEAAPKPKAAKRKPAPTTALATVPAPVAADKPAPINAHVAAGLNVAAYTGLSSFVNANRKPAVKLDVTREPSQLTSRMQKCFYAMRNVYGGKQFSPRGLDNGILSNLLAAKLIAHKPNTGTRDTLDGSPYLLDGEKPVAFNITATGLRYGKA